MFQGLRESSPFYILYKADPRLVVGEVVSVSNPVPQFGNIPYQAGSILPPKSYVDVKVSVGSETMDFQKLPADAVIADFGANNVVVSESKDAILNEIMGFRKVSEKALSETEHHKHVVTECDKMLMDLNPQIRKEAEQAEEIDNLKKGLEDLRGCMVDLKGMLSQALGRNSKDN